MRVVCVCVYAEIFIAKQKKIGCAESVRIRRFVLAAATAATHFHISDKIASSPTIPPSQKGDAQETIY
jgi:hypothetical protein